MYLIICIVEFQWFKLMTARHYSLGVTKQNFDAFSTDLFEMMEIMKHAKFGQGQGGHWKPFQRGFVFSTTSILEQNLNILCPAAASKTA